jgi:acyl carrier protein
MATLEQRVITAFAKGAMKEESDLTLDSRFEDIGIDSTDLICMIFELEEEFDIEIPQEFESMELHTLRDVADAVQKFVEDNKINVKE